MSNEIILIVFVQIQGNRKQTILSLDNQRDISQILEDKTGTLDKEEKKNYVIIL